MTSTEQSVTTGAADTALQDIARRVQDEREPCVLFLGAAIHAAPPPESPFQYPPEFRPPLGRALSQTLAANCGCDPAHPDHEPGDLQRTSLCYEIRHGRGSLIDAIQQEVAANTRPSPALLALAELPFQLIITTNYDDLLERALRDKGKRPFVAVYNPRLETTFNTREWGVQRPFLLKIHGDIDQRDSVVITDEDYIQFVNRMRDQRPYELIPEAFRYHLSTTMNLFIGYSLMDYNLRLLFKTMRWGVDEANLPATYAIDIRPDRLIRDVWESHRRYVRFIVQNHWDFIPRLYNSVLGREMTV